MRRVTVKDIALHLNVAQGTVSKALADKVGISPEMKKRVLDAADELGYKANRLAQGLARKPITIGIIMPAVWQVYYELINRGIQERLKVYGDYKIDVIQRSISQLHSEDELEKYVDECVALNVDVVILCPAFNSACGRCLEKLTERGIRYIFLGTDVPGTRRVSCIQIDARKAGRLAGEFTDLIMRQSRKAALFLGNRGMLEHDEKRVGFSQALEAGKGTVVGVYETQDMPEIASIITKNVVLQHPDIEVIYVATSNSVAVCEALDEIDPEGKIRVVATDVFRELIPYVESGRIAGIIYQDPEKMGARAIDHACSLIFDGKTEFNDSVIRPVLVLRANIHDFI